MTEARFDPDTDKEEQDEETSEEQGGKTPPRPPRSPEADEPEPGKGAGRKGNVQPAPEDQRGKPDPKETDHPTPPKGR